MEPAFQSAGAASRFLATVLNEPESTPDSKRKRSEYENGSAPSPSPSEGAFEPGSSTVNGDPQNVEVLAQDSATDHPRLSISRHPTFTPIPNTGDPPLCTTDLCLVNRALNQVGYRYYPAGLAEPGSTIAYHTIESRPTSVRVSWEDRSPFIRVSEDGLHLGGQGGFRSARANTPVREGKWYMEINVLKAGGDDAGQKGMLDGAHVRLGWGRREAPLNGPVGLDGYSYGIRDKTGDRVTLSRPKPYGKPFGTGDVIGMYISLPPKRIAHPDDPNDPTIMLRHRIAIKYKGQEYWETLEIPQSKEMIALTQPKPKNPHGTKDAGNGQPIKKSAAVKNAPGSQRKPPIKQEPKLRALPTLGHESTIAFFVNGECQGVAFDDLYDYLQLRKEEKEEDNSKKKENVPGQHVDNPFDDGTLGYYPFFSLYGDARIRINPGPDFKHPPPENIDSLLGRGECESAASAQWRPICERYSEWMQEMWAQDQVDEERAKIAVAEAAEKEKEDQAKENAKEKRKQVAARRKGKAKGKSVVDPNGEQQPVSLDSRFGPEIDEFLNSSVDSASYAESAGSNENDITNWSDGFTDERDRMSSPSGSPAGTSPSAPISYYDGVEEQEEQESKQGGPSYARNLYPNEPTQAEMLEYHRRMQGAFS